MAKPELVMDLGFVGRAYRDLDPYEQFAWADRLRAYCIFPNVEAERNAYLACRTAYRIRSLESVGPTYAIPAKLRRYREKGRTKYLKEERRYFGSVGGIDALLNSYGLEVYKQYEDIFMLNSVDLSRIAFNLIQLHSTEGVKAPASVTKAVALASDASPKKDHETSAEKESIKSPIGKPVVSGFSGTNENYLHQMWRRYKPALPICITYGIVTLGRIGRRFVDPNTGDFDTNKFDKEKTDSIDDNAFAYGEVTGVVGLVLKLTEFLVTHRSHAQHEPHLVAGEYWRFADNLIEGIEPADDLPLGPLEGSELEWAKGFKTSPKNL